MPWFSLKTIRLLHIHPKEDTITVHSWALSLPCKTMDAFVNLRDTEITRLLENIPIFIFVAFPKNGINCSFLP